MSKLFRTDSNGKRVKIDHRQAVRLIQEARAQGTVMSPAQMEELVSRSQSAGGTYARQGVYAQ